MAEKVWIVQVKTWEMRLMYTVDAKEAIQRRDYTYAPVGGYTPPEATGRLNVPPRVKVA